MNIDQKILSKYIESHTSEALTFIENLKESEVSALLESLPIELSALLLSQMDRFMAAKCLQKVDIDVAVQLIEKLPITVTEVLLRQIDEAIRNSLLDGLPPFTSRLLRRTLKYPKNSVGAHLNPLAFTLYEDQSITQGLEKIKKSNPQLHAIIPILSRDHKLVGFIKLQALITDDANRTIQHIMNTDVPKIMADMSIADLMEGWIDDEAFSHMPVVDASGVFLGEITKLILSKINQKKNRFDQEAIQASSALGELYQIGLSSLFRSASEIVGNR